jgi:glycosyltransferase involved in cell wall biosynthesis
VRILIIEPHASGHHASYLRWLVQAAAQKRWTVVVAVTAAALSHPQLAGIAGEFSGVSVHIVDDMSVDDVPVGGSLGLMRKELAYWFKFRRIAADVIKNSRIDAVLLPYVDYCFYALALLGSPFRALPWCGVSMRLRCEPTAAGDTRMPFKWRLARRVLAGESLKAMFSINPSVQDVPAAWRSNSGLAKLHYLADPAQGVGVGLRQESRATLGISDTDVAILVFGTLDERKGIDLLLAALASHHGLENYVVILAGRQSSNVRSELRKSQPRRRLVEIDRHLTDQEQSAVFAAADVVWVGYRSHLYMSGVLVLAGNAALPVIGTPDGEIGRLIAAHDIGVAVRVEYPAEVAAALRSMLDDGTRREMGQRAQSAFAGHTVEDFAASVLGALL